MVPVTFEFDAGPVDQVELVFPIFWGELSRDPVRMSRAGDTFLATVELPLGALVRYQFRVPTFSYDQREQYRPDLEVNRMAHVTGPATISNRVHQWSRDESDRPVAFHGRVTDAATGAPVSDAVVAADGILGFTNGDGRFELALRQGSPQVVVFLLDGSYRTQSRTVDADSADFQLEASTRAKVTINLDASPPEHHVVRMYSSAEQTGHRSLTGNRFVTESYIAVDGPVTLDLHDGQFVEYLYTVANPAVGFEHENGRHIARHFIASDGLVIDDAAGSFTTDHDTVLLVEVPEFTPPHAIVGVTGIHPTALLMHRINEREWTLRISNYDAGGRTYRYYQSYPGIGDEPRLDRTITSTAMHDVIDRWKYQSGPLDDPGEFAIPPIGNRFFVYGFLPDFYSNFHALLAERTFDHIAESGIHGVVLSQVWGYSRLQPTPKLTPNEPLPLYTPARELKRLANLAHERGLEVSLVTQTVGAEVYLGDPQVLDDAWWDAWMVEIEAFNLYNARVAEEAGIEQLYFIAKVPGFLVPDSYLARYSEGLRTIIGKVHEIYHGTLVVPYDFVIADYWRDGDLTSWGNDNGFDVGAAPTQAEVDAAVAKAIDERYRPAHDGTGNPVIVILGYSSVDGALQGRIVPESDGPYTEAHLDYPLDVVEQRMIHEAFYRAANERDWIAGIYLFGYGFTDAPESRDIGVRGKPSEAVASAWAKALRAE